jgi:hypothetical protein
MYSNFSQSNQARRKKKKRYTREGKEKRGTEAMGGEERKGKSPIIPVCSLYISTCSKF